MNKKKQLSIARKNRIRSKRLEKAAKRNRERRGMMLDLEKLAADAVFEFLFIALPLRIVGATASPIRPIAIA